MKQCGPTLCVFKACLFLLISSLCSVFLAIRIVVASVVGLTRMFP